MKTRTDLLNFLIQMYSLKRYLELGVQDAEQNFVNVLCADKAGVDAEPVHFREGGFIHRATTDDFFKRLDASSWDIIFIDASHIAEQVEKDFINSVDHLKDGGFIVLHDCNPLEEWHTTVPRPSKSGHWNGDVFKFACQLVDITTVDIDNGCGVIQYGKTGISKEFMPRTWKEFNDNRKILLNLVSWEEFTNLHSPS